MKISVPTSEFSVNLEMLAVIMKNDAEFRTQAGHAVGVLYRALATAADDFGFEADLDAGVLTVDFGGPSGRIVISPHVATHQVWLTAATTVYKLRWDVVENDFVLDKTDETLKELLEQAISRQVGEDVLL
jgi:CyaY protein